MKLGNTLNRATQGSDSHRMGAPVQVLPDNKNLQSSKTMRLIPIGLVEGPPGQ